MSMRNFLLPLLDVLFTIDKKRSETEKFILHVIISKYR